MALEHGELVRFKAKGFETQSALWEIRDELNLHSRIDIKMISTSLLDEEEEENASEQQNSTTALINPLIKAHLLYVAPKSLQIDQKFFKQ